MTAIPWTNRQYVSAWQSASWIEVQELWKLSVGCGHPPPWKYSVPHRWLIEVQALKQRHYSDL